MLGFYGIFYTVVKSHFTNFPRLARVLLNNSQKWCKDTFLSITVQNNSNYLLLI